MKANEKLLTPAQIADTLQVSEKTVRRWLNEGKLSGIKLEQFWRVKPADFEAYLARHQKNTH